MSSDDDMPRFIAAKSPTGALNLSWPPFSAHELHVWILLRDPDLVDPHTLSADALLRDLIRVPVAAERGRARVFVPVDRALGVLLMARDVGGRPLPPPPLDVLGGPPVAEPAPAEAPRGRDLPPAGDDPKKIPLIFARGAPGHVPPPSLDLLARGVAARLSTPKRGER
jgi:hypothetical protein